MGIDAHDRETIAELLALHRGEPRTIIDTVRRSYARLAAAGDPAMFIALRPEAEVVAEAEVLSGAGDRKAALFGIPVAVKDNIDADSKKRNIDRKPKNHVKLLNR